jgi:uncharacterized protein (UPF0332 family)
MINPFFRDIAFKLLEFIPKHSKASDKEKDMVYRTVINRLYYSAFHNIVLFLHIQFTSLDERAIHAAIQEKRIIHDDA